MNEILETITTNENNTNSKEPIHEATKEEDLLKLFKQISYFTQATWGWLGVDVTIVISKASIQGTIAAYHLTVQEQPSIVG